MRTTVHNLTGTIFFAASIAAALSIGAAAPATAQELNCRVRIDMSSLQGTDEFSHVTQLKPLIEEYLNNRAWTNERFRPEERIRCDFEITMLSGSSAGRKTFNAQLTVGAFRPIYGTTQETNVAQIADGNWVFGFEPNSSLIYDPDRYDPLTSVLDFYAYLILGYDYDTFFPLGGTPYFERAQEIVFLAPQGGAGWTVGSENTRGTLVNQLLDQRLEPLRKAYFDYHFGCLDHFVQDPNEARESALKALNGIQSVIDEVSNQYAIDLFLATKNQEIVGVFEDSGQASVAYGILLDIDPSRSSIYDRLVR